jgi:hypothetical protein
LPASEHQNAQLSPASTARNDSPTRILYQSYQPLRIEQQGTEEKLLMMQKVRRKKNIDQEKGQEELLVELLQLLR